MLSFHMPAMGVCVRGKTCHNCTTTVDSTPRASTQVSHSAPDCNEAEVVLVTAEYCKDDLPIPARTPLRVANCTPTGEACVSFNTPDEVLFSREVQRMPGGNPSMTLVYVARFKSNAWGGIVYGRCVSGSSSFLPGSCLAHSTLSSSSLGLGTSSSGQLIVGPTKDPATETFTGFVGYCCVCTSWFLCRYTAAGAGWHVWSLRHTSSGRRIVSVDRDGITEVVQTSNAVVVSWRALSVLARSRSCFLVALGIVAMHRMFCLCDILRH